MVRQNQKELADILQGGKFESFLCHMTKIFDKNGTEFMVGNGVSHSVICLKSLRMNLLYF